MKSRAKIKHMRLLAAAAFAAASEGRGELTWPLLASSFALRQFLYEPLHRGVLHIPHKFMMHLQEKSSGDRREGETGGKVGKARMKENVKDRGQQPLIWSRMRLFCASVVVLGNYS